MIKVQPYGNHAFSMSRSARYSSPVSFGDDADETEEMSAEDKENMENLQKTKRNFEKISKSKNSTSSLKKVTATGAIIATALVGGITMKWGLNTSLDLFAEMAKNSAAKPIIKGFKDAGKEIKKWFKELSATIKETENYKRCSAKFKNSSFGNKTIELLDKFKKSDFYVSVKNSLKNAKSKVREWFVTISSGFAAIGSGAKAAAVKAGDDKSQTENTKNTNKEEDYE